MDATKIKRWKDNGGEAMRNYWDGPLVRRIVRNDRKCNSCGWEDDRFYDIPPFSWDTATCARCFLDECIKGQRIIGYRK